MENNKTREEGYYWVNINSQDGWMIARWDGEEFILHTWSENRYKGHEFDEIDETPITRNEHGQES